PALGHRDTGLGEELARQLLVLRQHLGKRRGPVGAGAADAALLRPLAEAEQAGSRVVDRLDRDAARPRRTDDGRRARTGAGPVFQGPEPADLPRHVERFAAQDRPTESPRRLEAGAPQRLVLITDDDVTNTGLGGLL